MIDMKSGMFTSLSGEWETPDDLYEQLDRVFRFNLDAAATKENSKAQFYCEDGLEGNWWGNVFLNPPYGREISDWMMKVLEQWWHTTIIVALVPSRTDTKWWHDCVMKADRICFIKGRLKFSGHKNSAPFPSAIVVWRGKDYILDEEVEKWM